MGCPSSMNDDYQLTLKVLLDRGIRDKPNDMNVVTKIDNGCHRMSFKQFKRATIKLANALSANGIGIGNLISTFMWNNARHLQLYYTVPSMGSVLHPINIRLHPKELGYIVSHAQPKIVFIDANLIPMFERIDQSKLSSIQLYIICGDNMKSGGWTTSKLNNYNTIDFDDFINKFGRNKGYKFPTNLSEASGALLCYTSGVEYISKIYIFLHNYIQIIIKHI